MTEETESERKKREFLEELWEISTRFFHSEQQRSKQTRETDKENSNFRISPDARGLNYDKFYVEGQVRTEGDEAYTSHNTNRLDVDGVVAKIMTTDYVKEELEGRPHLVEA